jgi:lysozyme
MPDFTPAIWIIKKFEGFSEKACPDPATGEAPYTIGYGTTFYPDGSPVLKGQLVSKKKALQYLNEELKVIAEELEDLHIELDHYMEAALLSFIHSVGWEAFLYSSIVDAIEREDFNEVINEFNRWIFDSDHQVIGGLIERRREEGNLFLTNIGDCSWTAPGVLLKAFRDYEASLSQVNAIRKLEEAVNPYLLSEFANDFGIATSRSSLIDHEIERLFYAVE